MINIHLILLFVSVNFTYLVTAQSGNFSYSDYIGRPAEKITTAVDFYPELVKSQEYLLKVCGVMDSCCTLKLLYKTTSPLGKHYLYQQYYRKTPIYDAVIKVNVNFDHKILSIFNKSVPAFSAPVTEIVKKAIDFSGSDTILRNNIVFIPFEGELVLFDFYEILNGDKNYELLVNTQSQLRYGRDLRVYYTDSLLDDSLASVKVFYPDPLTTSSNTYGGVYVDSSDIDFDILNDERVDKVVPVKYDANSNQYKLEHDYVKVTDHSVPFISPSVSLDGNFHFTRAQSGFEDVNAYFHIYTYKCYTNSLGFGLVNYPIHIDTHGNNGSDNSFFTASSNPPRITFGEGGVDDAEDADVIIHEYGHAISHSAAPNTNSGVERQAIDEGFGDYLASSYSLSLNSYNWENVFSWDGHNPFWSGRSSISTKHYPEDKQNNLYQDADIWSSTLMEINQHIGREEFDRILFTSLFSYSSGLSMVDAAELLIQTDSILNNGLYYNELCFYLGQRGFIPECSLSVESPDLENEIIVIRNSALFSRGEALVVNFKTKGSYNLQLSNMRGQIILTSILNVMNDEDFELSSSQLPKGSYILTIFDKERAVSHKLVRYQ